MLKWEICYSPIDISDTPNLINKLIKLFRISEDIAPGDVQGVWVNWLFTSHFTNLTVPEIFNAHKLAMNGVILNEDNEFFKIFPTLSAIQSASILRAYVKYKHNNDEVWKAKQNLKKYNQPEKTEEEKLKEQEIDFKNYIELIFHDIKETGFTNKATHLYSKLLKLGKIKIDVEGSKKLYQKELKIYLRTIKMKKELKSFDLQGIKGIQRMSLKEIKEKILDGILVVEVQNKCRDVCISQYLKKFSSIELLKQEIKNIK